MASKGTPATAAVAKAKVEHRIHEYRHDPGAPSYGLEAAERLGVDPAMVFKTLVADVDGRLAVAVVPVAARLDLKALASAAGGRRAAMAEPADAERATGYVVGGISPLGHRRRCPSSSTSRCRAGRRSWSAPAAAVCSSSWRRPTWPASPAARSPRWPRPRSTDASFSK